MKRRRKIRPRAYIRVWTARFLALVIVVSVFVGGFLLIRAVVRQVTGDDQAMETFVERRWPQKKKRVYDKPEMIVDLLPLNEYSRPGEELLQVHDIFVHYTANPGTDAAQNRNYFANLALTGETSASAHFIIGYEGEIIQCLPLTEIGYAVKGRNYDSISIECCYLDENGQFTEATYRSLVHLVAWLMGEYDLNKRHVLRHYDEGGKNCPKFYVEQEEAWEEMVRDIGQYIKDNGTYERKMD